MTANELIRELRTRKGLSQRRLALRAGTSQSAIDRIERGEQDVTWTRLRSILLAMGEEPVLASRPVPGRYDPDDLLRDRSLALDRRLDAGLKLSRFVDELHSAAKSDRDGGRG